MAFGLSAGLSMILCVGEKVEERKAGQVEAVLGRQLTAGLEGLGAAATPETVARGLRAGLGHRHGADRRSRGDRRRPWVRARFPGIALPRAWRRHPYSVWWQRQAANAGQILGIDNVDGVLVGGASLEADSFAAIAAA